LRLGDPEEGSGGAPPPKWFLVNFKLKIAHLVVISVKAIQQH